MFSLLVVIIIVILAVPVSFLENMLNTLIAIVNWILLALQILFENLINIFIGLVNIPIEALRNITFDFDFWGTEYEAKPFEGLKPIPYIDLPDWKLAYLNLPNDNYSPIAQAISQILPLDPILANIIALIVVGLLLVLVVVR